jgi:hypothetical protein
MGTGGAGLGGGGSMASGSQVEIRSFLAKLRLYCHRSKGRLRE